MRHLFAIGLLTASITASLPAAQQQFRAGADIVEVHATVKLKNGTIAHDLAREDFELFEDGKPREITVFSQSIQPLSVAMVLDRSGSAEGQFENVRQAAREFVGRLLRGDRTSISTLMWDCQPFTDNPRMLLTVLGMDLPTDYGSPIWAATDHAMSALEGESGRRVILLFSDGIDNQLPYSGAPPTSQAAGGMSPCAGVTHADIQKPYDVAKRAEREAVMVYTVSVDSAGNADLANLARQSGAAYQRLGSYSEVKAAFRSVVDELHLQYVLGFVPTKTDGKMHKIEVKAKRPGVTVQARKVYMAEKK